MVSPTIYCHSNLASGLSPSISIGHLWMQEPSAVMIIIHTTRQAHSVRVTIFFKNPLHRCPYCTVRWQSLPFSFFRLSSFRIASRPSKLYRIAQMTLYNGLQHWPHSRCCSENRIARPVQINNSILDYTHCLACASRTLIPHSHCCRRQ